MYQKLVYLGIFTLLLPILFVLDNEYITGLGWWGVEVMHGVQYHGIQLYFCLLVIAATMFFGGLAHPPFSIWVGEKTRKRSSIVYGFAMSIAIIGLIEVNLIALGIYKYEDKIMASFYEDIKIGEAVHEARRSSRSLNKHLRYTYTLAERESNLIAAAKNGNFVEFSYPNQFRTRRMIVETNLHPAHEDAQVIGKYLIVNSQVTQSET